MLDMIRVIILRLIRGKHPFKGDKTIHHIIGENKQISFNIILSLNSCLLIILILYQNLFFINYYHCT